MKDTIWLDTDGQDERDDLHSARGIINALAVSVVLWLLMYALTALH